MSPEKMTEEEVKKALDCRESPCSEVSLKNCRDCFMKEREDNEKEQEAREVAEARAEDLKEKNKVLKGEKVAMKIRIDRLMAHTKKHDRKVYKAQGEEKDAKRKMDEAINEVKRWQRKFAHQDTVIRDNDKIIEKKNKVIETLKKALIIRDKEAVKALEEEKGKADQYHKNWNECVGEMNKKDGETSDLKAFLKKVRKEVEIIRASKNRVMAEMEALRDDKAVLEQEKKPKKPKKKRRSWFSRR